jgi:sortase A
MERRGTGVAERSHRVLSIADAVGHPNGHGSVRSRKKITRRLVADTIGRSLMALGLVAALFLGFEFGISRVSATRSQRALLERFSTELAAGSTPNAGALPVPGEPVAILRIPSIGLAKVVVEGTRPEDLKRGPGHVRNTPLPGETGNVVIAGKRSTYGAPFGRIGSLDRGDDISLVTAETTAHYAVVKALRVSPGDADVLSSTTDDSLTRVTSDGATGRLVVTARLHGSPLVAPVLSQAIGIAPHETGVAGDGGGLPAVLGWGELLALTLILAWRATRRWPRSTVYVLAAPACLALLILLFQSADRLLPGTL